MIRNFNACCPIVYTPDLYVEVDNNNLDIAVSFTVKYVLPSGCAEIKHSPIFYRNQVKRIPLPANCNLIFVSIFNRSTTPPTLLLSGQLLRLQKTCFEVNGTSATARAREVNC